MTAVGTVKPNITPADRLGLTLMLAILVHAVIVLGFYFIEEPAPAPRYSSMDVILVEQKSETAEDAKLLAQANLVGGGDVEENFNVRESASVSGSRTELQQATGADAAQTAAEEQPVVDVEDSKQALMPSIAVDNEQSAERVADNIDTPTKVRQVTEQRPLKTTQEQLTAVQTPQKETQIVDNPALPSAAQLVVNSFESISSAELRERLEKRAKRPKKTYINASTKEFKYAAYMAAWQAKVERIGNLNYPEQARQQRITGNLILEVALNQDGSINEVIVHRSSGRRILDEAAIRIVELAAPYASFPDNIKADTDTLHIIRTWRFDDKKGFQ